MQMVSTERAAALLAYCFGFVTAEIVHDHDVAGTKRGDKDLLDIGPEALTVDGTVE